MPIQFYRVTQLEGIIDEFNAVKERIENKVNLSRTVGKEKRFTLPQNKVMRICFIAGLSLPAKREEADFKNIVLSKNSTNIVPSFFTMHNLSTLYSALLKIRYAHLNIDWTHIPTL